MARYYSQVVVGFDGSREGERSLRWAVDEARRRHIGLTVCHAWAWPYPDVRPGADVRRAMEETAEHVLDHGVALARELAPRSGITGRLVEGPAALALTQESAGAELVVVGANGLEETALGATAFQVAARASCPVIVVRDVGPGDGRVVIGYDGSVASVAALAFGFEEAALQGWRVHIVHGQGAEPGAETEPSRQAVSARVDDALAPWAQRHPNIDAKTSIVPEPARRALAEAAEGAQMLVVGDRETDGIPPLLLGSTSQALLQHAPCPIALVHPRRRERPPDFETAGTGSRDAYGAPGAERDGVQAPGQARAGKRRASPTRVRRAHPGERMREWLPRHPRSGDN
ncbi:universal stress protein [Actinomadura sp. 9N407]|uniref:universal stress protein n=1 Tax=Actinomadura sp. 9N407 TaxID=3375154 RepID=UPI00378A05C0